MESLEDLVVEPIAIIGSSCRLPGAINSPGQLWEFLKAPTDLQTEIPPSRFNVNGFFHEDSDHHGATNVSSAYLLAGNHEVFDHEFFKIHAKEAESMDPQQRILLETVYEAIETAGYSVPALKGSSTAVFVGQMLDDYRDLLYKDVEAHPQYIATGASSRAITANRVSYFFDWKGPSMTIDTACSSSLVALHQAVQSLRSAESSMAIVAGVNLLLSPDAFLFESSFGMLSPTGRSRMWDAAADGYARGEGFVVLVAKTLRQAIIDNDDIECIIRNTGVNQDGRSAGLTVPSGEAQEALIRSTYARCGLDCRKDEDRCQYFEAHGTGTLVGDPKEAEAIHKAFFTKEGSDDNVEGGPVMGSKLRVGSIKTVLGHLEGTAGLAGFLKASLAVQNGLIPPNMHFERLNPTIRPFYDYLEVPTKPLTWPETSPGSQRRASINSFGFGGTNAHAIIESWNGQIESVDHDGHFHGHDDLSSCGPFTVSANSHTALLASVESLSATLRADTSISLARISWTLQVHRTPLPFRASFSATTKEQLIEKLNCFVRDTRDSRLPTKVIKASQKVSVLGVFTGQGAQWPRMGAGLYKFHPSFRNRMQQLEATLKEIPDGPSWALTEELLAPAASTRVSSAEIAQPLCTAVQIALVDLLTECGVSFAGVIGHSSGEIAAAYAAGVLDAPAAMLISYYRGYHSKLSRSPSGEAGAMIAVGMSMKEGEAFCDQPEFHGRIRVAASNSESSITLSGDFSAVYEAKRTFDDTNTFSRVLRVDKAYHSHHMDSVHQPYLESLRQCKIHAEGAFSEGNCTWFSTVYESKEDAIQVSCEDSYWAENMVKPVLFSQALTRAIRSRHFDLAIEVGPHPALQGPVNETLKYMKDSSMPYTGTLKRDEDDVISFWDTIGSIWASLESSSSIISFRRLREALCTSKFIAPRVLKGLPSYPWDHRRPFLSEPKKAKQWRTRHGPVQELLGTPSYSCNNEEVRWRNILKLSEIPWLSGHVFQDEVLFPAAGYLSMAINATIHLAGGKRTVRMIELRDCKIHNAVTLEDGVGVDVELVVRLLYNGSDHLVADISCCCSNCDTSSTDFDKKAFTGQAVMFFGDPDMDTLPSRVPPDLPMAEVSLDRFYSWMRNVGLDYSGHFLMSSIQRRRNIATVTAKLQPTNQYIIHPSTLDTVLQSIFAAFSYPGDGTLWTAYLPTEFHRVRVNMASCSRSTICQSSELVADCRVAEASASKLSGDIDVYCAEDDLPEVQIQGFVLSSLEVPSESNDQFPFARTVWAKDMSSCTLIGPKHDHTDLAMIEYNCRLHEICERTAYFYLRSLCDQIPDTDSPSLDWHYQCLMRWARDHVLPAAQTGSYPGIHSSWCHDTLEVVVGLMSSEFNGQIDLQLLHKLGSRFPSIVRGSVSALQLLMEDDMLRKLYQHGFGFPEANARIGSVVGQISHRYPKVRVLEVGSGTGGATSMALRHLGRNVQEYYFTDISPGFFEEAQRQFAGFSSIMKYELLDIEKCPTEQGFESQSFDVIIASNVLHATKFISRTLNHCRELLRPGGYLVLLELTSQGLRIPFLFSGLPGWWLGHEDGRTLGPTISEEQWNFALRESRFSGIDHSLKDFQDDSIYSYSVMVSQAVDDRISSLRAPLKYDWPVDPSSVRIQELIIVGGQSWSTSALARNVQETLRPYAETVVTLNQLEDVPQRRLQLGSAVVCLSDLDESAFIGMSQHRLEAMQLLFKSAKYFLWITKGCRASEPIVNAIVGLGRTIAREMSLLRLKFVDFDCIENHTLTGAKISETLLEMILLDLPGFDQILWSNETEISVERGNTYIPRVVPDEDLNIQFNATRRNVFRAFLPASKPVKVRRTRNGAFLEEMTVDESDRSAGAIEVQVTSSSLFPFVTSDNDGHLFFCSGYIKGRKKMVLAISQQNASMVCVEQDHVVELPLEITTGSHSDQVLQGFLTLVLCESILTGVTKIIWIHNANNEVFEVATQLATAKGIRAVFSTNDKTSKLALTGKSTYIHPRTSKRELKKLIPRNVDRFVNWESASGAEGFEDLVSSCLDRHVDIHKGLATFDTTQPTTLSYSKAKLVNILTAFSSNITSLGYLKNSVHGLVINVDALHGRFPERTSPTVVLNWVDLGHAPVRVVPTSEGNCFTAHQTHFLVGLTGDVGLSLCEWMIDRGATHFALASRSPKIDPRIIRHFEQKGATIRVFCLDISDQENLKQVHAEIASTMPPISGVVNGALVLRDKPFESMRLEDLELVFGPRVTGSQNLDNLFYGTPLDYFILLSSLAGIVGNPGQSNYNATNMFMSALAAQRRKRGLSASVLDIGMLVGFGSLHNDVLRGPKLSVEANFRREGFLSIAEPDFHIMFGEAIKSGHPQSGLDHEIVTGLGDHFDTLWRRLPRFSHYNIEDKRGNLNQGQTHTQRNQSIHDLLTESDSVEQTLSILQDSVTTKLGLLLGSSAENIDRDVALATLGVDSLVAVEVRSWLMKMLEVDLPVLKILGGASVSDICAYVVGKLPIPLRSWAANLEESLDEDSPLHLSDFSSSVLSVTTTPEQASSPAQNEERALLNHEVVDLDGTISPLTDQVTKDASERTWPETIYERVAEVSSAQEQLYFLHEYLENKSSYNVAYYGTFGGSLDIVRLQGALSTVGKQHESLRSAYFRDQSTKKACQGVLAEPRIIFEHRDCVDGEAQTTVGEVKDFVFDIENGVVMKVTVLSESPDVHFILFNHHHIALDGLSWSIFVEDLAQAYSGRNRPTFIQQSIDMTRKRLSSMKPEILKDDLGFWERTYESPPEQLPLFAFANVNTRRVLTQHINDSVGVEFGPEITDRVRSSARKLGMTSFHFYLASLAAFLSRCLAVNDVAIGIVDANRFDAEDFETIGYFLNVLPVRISLRSDDTFDTVAKRSRRAALDAMCHSRTPYDTILSHLGVSRSSNLNPFFQVAVNFHKGLKDQTVFGTDGMITWMGGVPAGNPYDLLVNIHEFQDRTLVSFVTQSYMYNKVDVELMLGWFSYASKCFATDSSTRIGNCPIANDSEIRSAVQLGRGSVAEIPWQGTLVHRIDEMIREHSAIIAIQDDDGSILTYAQMQARTLQIARNLRKMSVPLGSFVAMLLEPSVDAICTILAIMRIGMVWVPLDTKNHPERLHSILAETQPPVLVCHGPTREQAQRYAKEMAYETLVIDLDTCSSSSEDNSPVCNISDENQPAAILYTSGSTGVPKGVILSHQGLVNQIYGTTAQLDLGREVTLQQSPLGFDLMLDQVFLALCNGGTVVVVGNKGRGDPVHVAYLIVSQRVTLTHFVPSEYLALLNYGFHILKGCTFWRFAMSGGERLVPELRRAFRKLESGQLQLVNVYGPAEITIACARGFVPYRTEEDVLSSIDHLRASPNYCIEITDKDLNIVPVGHPGEVCISGFGVALGYLNRPEETKRKFFTRSRPTSILEGSTSHLRPGSPRVYRSGDLGRILPDGTLKILGRLDGDSQVKIRGHRVELEEISNAIVQVSRGSVVNAAVSLRASDVLAAFIVFDTEFIGNKINFAKDLAANLPLPLYMRPAFIVPVDKIPANENGKTDRRRLDRLPIPNLDDREDEGMTGCSEHMGPMEISLKDNWEEVIASRAAGTRLRTITSNSDFFEVGGNSLLLIKLRSILQSIYGLTLSLPELFQSSTLSSMAARITERVKHNEELSEQRQAGISQIKWDVELATMSDGLPEIQTYRDLSSTFSNSPSGVGGLAVLLTGATGFIGRHLLQYLAKDPRVKTIHCVSIRPASSGQSRSLSVTSPKIVQYWGDLSSLSLGLSDAEYTSLSNTVDVIIHNGADVSLLKSYQTLRRSNVISTRTLCELAMPRGVPIHFVSTAAVARIAIDYFQHPSEVLPEVSVAMSKPTDEINGYIASKWASEVLLEKIAKDRGLPVWVHRLAHVVGDDPSELDAVGMLIKYSMLTGQLPAWIECADVAGEWDFVSVQDVVQDLVAAAVRSTNADHYARRGQEQAEAHYVNHCAGSKVPHHELQLYLEGVAGAPLRVIETDQWLQAAVEHGMSPLICDFLAGFFTGANKVVLPLLAKGKSR